MLRWGECHVDHDGVPFRDIVRSFLAMNGIGISGIKTSPAKHGGLEMTDGEQIENWRQWHASKANLRILEKGENMSLGAHDGDWRSPSEKVGRPVDPGREVTIDYVNMSPDEIELAEASFRMAIEQAVAAAADRAGDAAMFMVACSRIDELAVEVKRLEQAARDRLAREDAAGRG